MCLSWNQDLLKLILVLKRPYAAKTKEIMRAMKSVKKFPTLDEISKKLTRQILYALIGINFATNFKFTGLIFIVKFKIFV